MRKSNLNLKGKLAKLNEQFHGSDRFLGKDVLTMANKINSSRNIMFNSHLEQAVVLYNPDFAKVYTNYENEVGSFSSSYKRTEAPLKVMAKVPKFSEYPDVNYVLVVKKGNEYDIIERKIGEKLTEGYCYLNVNDKIDAVKVGETLPENEVLFHSTSFDDQMNYRYGVNAKVVYMINNDTLEDAILATEDFADQTLSHYMEDVEVNVNGNDILGNIYGEGMEYKAFPDIGEKTKGTILVSRRRINYEHALYDLQNENLKMINNNTDMVFYAEGTLIDIDVYCNQDLEKIEKYFYNSQIVKYLKMSREYYQKLVEVLGPIVENPKAKCSDDLTHLYRRAKDALNPAVQWKNEKSDFDNIVISFKILKEQRLHVGSKIVGKYGNKGVISKLVKREDMPYTIMPDGTKLYADLVFNALGVVNRLNPAQLYELELNFIAENIQHRLRSMSKMSEKVPYFFDFMRMVNAEQASLLERYFNSLDKAGRVKFFADIDEKGIYLHQPPFWGNVSFDQLADIYDAYPWIQPYVCYIGDQQIQNRLIIGDAYIMKLKHEPKGKFSARSTSYINMKGIPSKSLNYKKNQNLYSTTPIRLGEMEIDNLLLTQRPDEVVRMSSMYSGSEANRHQLVETLLTEDVLDLEEIILDNPSDNHNREILDVYFKSIGIALEGDEDGIDISDLLPETTED